MPETKEQQQARIFEAIKRKAADTIENGILAVDFTVHQGEIVGAEIMRDRCKEKIR